MVAKRGKANQCVYEQQPDWWDSDCSKAKYVKHVKLRRFSTTQADSDLVVYLQSKGEFKNLCRAKRYAMERRRREELLMGQKNLNAFWKCIK